MDKMMVLCAYGVLICFLGILIWHVPRLDLGGIVLVTLVLAAVDTVQGLRSHDKKELPNSDRERSR